MGVSTIVWRFFYGGDEPTGAPPFAGTAENAFSSGWCIGFLTIYRDRLRCSLPSTKVHMWAAWELEKGEADVEGSIDSLVYTDIGPLQKKGSALARLFR